MRRHYPRTPHLPWSPGAAADDVRAGDLAGLVGREVVVTEKLDGENTTLYRDGLHARSLDSAAHPSRTWVKALQGRIGRAVPPGWRICGENLFARHSLGYTDLDSYFFGFSVWDAEDDCLDWDSTVRFLRRVGVPTPRVLWRGVFDERALRRLVLDPARQEGYVVRTVAGFSGSDFGLRAAKWVRRGHVQTDRHWMHSAVVPNGLGPAAALWAVRSGDSPDPTALSAAVGLTPAVAEGPSRPADEAADEAAARLDLLGRTGEARLAGVLAAALHDRPRAALAARLATALGLPEARLIADLVGLHPLLYRPRPDGERRNGLARLALAADLGVLHAVAGAVLGGRSDAEAVAAREQVDWSALHAEDARLLGEDPTEPLRTGLRAALTEVDGLGPHAGDRCWAEARDAWVAGRISTPEQAVAATWRWRSGRFPRLVQLVGPSGSGKSSFAAGLPDVAARISLDDLRTVRGSREDQRDNGEVLRAGLDRLDAALAAAGDHGGTVVWDATSLNRHQRSLVQAVARRRDALTVHAVLLVEEEELRRRNAVREHPLPTAALSNQLHRYAPPYPGEAHGIWYLGADGRPGDTDGVLVGPPPSEQPQHRGV